MAENLQAWIGQLIQQECEQVTAWCYGTKDNINSLGHGAYTRSSSEIESTFKDRRILQIDRFDKTVRHTIEARLSDSATFIHALFDKASIINHRKQTGNSFKVGTEGGFIEIKLYTLCLIVRPGKPHRAIFKIHDFTYLGQVGASTVGQPIRVEEQQNLCACLDQLGSVLPSTGNSRSPSLVLSQVGDSHIESQAPGISTQYLPSTELDPRTAKPTNRASSTTEDLKNLLAGKPLRTTEKAPPSELTRTEAQASLQHVLKSLVPAQKNRVSPTGNNAVLPAAAKLKQTVVSHESTTVSITPESPASDGEKKNIPESCSTKEQIARSVVCDESTNGDGKLGAQPQDEKEPQDCPWEELGRIPQRDMNIPKDQLKFLSQDSSWIRSVDDLKSPSSRVPPTTLQEVDKSIDHQELHELVQSGKKLDTAVTTMEIPSRLASTPQLSDSEDDIETDWEVSPYRGVTRAIDLPKKEAKIDDDDNLLEETEDEDKAPVQYAEEVSRFQELPPQIYSPPNERHSTDSMVEPCEESMNNVRPIISDKRSISYTSDNDDEMDEDDMELEIPHAIDDTDADMPDNLSSCSPSLEGNARISVQVERTPRTRTSAANISSQDNNFGVQRAVSIEAVSSSVELIPGTLESEVLRSNKGLATSPHSLDGFNDLEQIDDEDMLDNQLQPESGPDPVANTFNGTSMSRSDAQGAHLSEKSKKTTTEALERVSPAMLEAASSHSPKNTPFKSSRLHSKKRRIVREIDLEFSQASQEEMNTNDLANSNRRKFMENARENNSRFIDTGESVETQHQSSQEATRSAVLADQVQQPALATSVTSAAVATTPGRHVSFDQPGNISQPSPAQETASISGNQTPGIIQNGESSLEKPDNELDPSTEETIFGKYIAVYPSYEGSLRAFVRCAAYLKWLQETKSDPHRSLYDDIIRVFASIEYSEHIKEMKAKNEQPQPLLAFYNETVDTPIYNERIVLPSDLPDVLKLDHVEAAKSAKAFAERRSRSMNVSRATSVGSVRIPDLEYVSGFQMIGRTNGPDPVHTRQRFFETESQLQSNIRTHSPMPPLSTTANKEINEVTYEDTGLLFMGDDYDDIDTRPESARSSKKRKLPWASSPMDDVVSSPTALPASPVTRKENGSAALSSRFVQPRTTESRKSPVLGANFTPKSSLQKPGASRPFSNFSAVRSKISSQSSLTPLAANKPKPNPSRRYTMLPPNKSLEEFGERRVAKRPRHSMPARVSYERIEPATPAEVELVRLAREFVPKRMSLDGGYITGTPFSSANSRRKSAHQSVRYAEPETQDWGV